MITHVPCGGDDIDPAGRVLITAIIGEMDGSGGTAGYGRADAVWDDCLITKRGSMTFDMEDIDNWSDDFFSYVILHEVGHALGLG